MPALRKPAARRAPSRSDWSRVRLLALDVDGVLTDGTVQVSSDGTEAKSFSILDGMGLRKLSRAGVTVAWISGRPSGATTVRAKELGIPHVIQGCSNKLAALQELAAQHGLAAENCAYMGDDEIDVAAIAWAGVGVAPAGAMPVALAAARFVPHRAAGHGAVREVCELILGGRV